MEKKFTFVELVYDCCKTDELIKQYSLDQLKDKFSEVDSSTIDRFTDWGTKVNKAFNDIFRIFGITDFQDDFKVNGQYTFDENSKNNFKQLVMKYIEDSIWKNEIKKVDIYTDEKNNFLDLYRNSPNQIKLFEEIKFAVEIFLEVYGSLKNVPPYKKSYFMVSIYMATQYQNLCWLCSTQKIINLINMPSEIEITSSVCNILFKEHQKWLENLSNEINLLISEELKDWEFCKCYRHKQFDRFIKKYGERLNPFIEKCQEEFLKLRENNSEPFAGNVALRKRKEREREQVKKIIENTLKEQCLSMNESDKNDFLEAFEKMFVE